MNLKELFFVLLLFIFSINLHTKSFFPKFFKTSKEITTNTNKIPIVYHKNYDISFWGMEKLHHFDSCKYSKIAKFINKNCNIDNSRFYQPKIASEKSLLLVHSKEYLKKITDPNIAAKISEVKALSWVPKSSLQLRLLDSMKYATGGTILATKLALKYKWAINLSGGYHHAKADSGEGFCFYADIPVALNLLWKKQSNLKVMIIDLDAHQGNGIESIIKNDNRCAIFDVYNYQIYPNDVEAKKYIKFNYPIKAFTKDAQYLDLIKNELPKAIDQFKPNLIIYNAGTDIFEHDSLGCLAISQSGIIERDSLVFDFALMRNIPIAMVLSGGYSNQSYEIIGKSIQNILKKPKIRCII